MMRGKQVQDLINFYPEAQLLKNTPEKQEYRIPLKLSISKTPLFIRIDLLANFPQQPPIIQILARVFHQDIHPKTKNYCGQILQAWATHSTLLQVVRGMQIDFEVHPPIPENIQNQNEPQQEAPKLSRQLSSDDQIQLDKIKSLQNIDEKLKQMIHPPKYEELNEMKANESYLKDFILDRPEIKKFQEECDGIANKAEGLAQENVKKFEEISQLMGEHQKTVETYNQKKKNFKVYFRKLKNIRAKIVQKNRQQLLPKNAMKSRKHLIRLESNSISRKQLLTSLQNSISRVDNNTTSMKQSKISCIKCHDIFQFDQEQFLNYLNLLLEQIIISKYIKMKKQSSSQFVIILKKDIQTQSYSLEAAGPKSQVKVSATAQTPKQKNLKRTHQQMEQQDSKKQVAEILPPKAKKQASDIIKQETNASEKKGKTETIEQMSNADVKEETEIDQGNEESQTKIDETDQEYAKTSFIIPSCSAWFNLDKIHEIEMQSLPEFFCGKFPHKNPTTYMDYRNFIIKLYRECPNAYLSATVCRKNLPGDVCSIIRLHAFLEHWGLINFNVDPQLKPPKVQLGASGNLNPSIIDVAAKGYLKVQEAELLSQYYSKDDQQVPVNPSQNVFLIAAKKINVLSSHKRPICNFCGNLCQTYWYKKKPPLNSYALKEEQQLKIVGEHDSLHQTLKGLSQTYIVCKECFNEGNYPKILRENDFDRTSLESILQSQDFTIRTTIIRDDEMLSQQQEQEHEWSLDDKESLIEGVSKFDGDWEMISKKVFDNQYTPYECAFQFISLPISESMLLKFQNAVVKRNEDIMSIYTPTVFQDYSNPLLSQLAIFAKSLEYMDKEKDQQKQPTAQPQQEKAPSFDQPIQPSEPERRTTRKQQQAKKKEQQQLLQKQIHEDHGDLYLIPQSKAETCLSKDTLNQVVDKAEKRSKRLAKEKRKEIEGFLNLAIYHQMKKLEHKSKFLREFWLNFEVEKKDLHLIKEETLAERVALSVLKSGEIKGTNAEKILGSNEFSSNNQQLRPLNQ